MISQFQDSREEVSFEGRATCILQVHTHVHLHDGFDIRDFKKERTSIIETLNRADS